jgi:2,5-diamino-6-(ribosylamino)-4(3H)-pyrimidinone 5'-phosphate reductase
LGQYYRLEEETDAFSLNSGRVFAKIGYNEKKEAIEKIPVSFVVIDNKPHLTSVGVENLSRRTEKLFIVTNHKNHPVFSKAFDNVETLLYENDIDFADVFSKLKNVYDINRLTIQSGGGLNSVLLRSKLIDKISIVVAPALIGGKNTSTLIDGESLHTFEDLKNIKALKLDTVDILENSYIHLKYDIINETEIEK